MISDENQEKIQIPASSGELQEEEIPIDGTSFASPDEQEGKLKRFHQSLILLQYDRLNRRVWFRFNRKRPVIIPQVQAFLSRKFSKLGGY